MSSREEYRDPLVRHLQIVIRWAVRVLAVLMTFVIVMGVADVAWTLYGQLTTPPVMMMRGAQIMASFGSFMAVLIAIEIFINITIYLRDDLIHIRIVMATALMAVARKVIIFDMESVEGSYLWGLAAVVLAMSIGYWLVMGGPRKVAAGELGMAGDTSLENEVAQPDRGHLRGG
ncbi:MAG: phosphate-starvation-inducible PsiE family protein [Pirellulaceae bacterium]|nr:phosphate-starvation-inducible PsiE family protein [Pirellulaceae bacterium]